MVEFTGVGRSLLARKRLHIRRQQPLVSDRPHRDCPGVAECLEILFHSWGKPSAAQFATLIDSTVNIIEDSYWLGLRGQASGIVLTGQITAQRKDMLQWYQDMVSTSGRKDMLQWYNNIVQDYRGIQARTGAFAASPDLLWMAKLCPGHISCPTYPPLGGVSNPLGLSASRGIAVDIRRP